ncbi:MAG: ribosome biogenesis GTPase Der [Acidobacteria bacterium]|nr:ribosome biogenesis GTPase Der [Acidobacteriota bacterium]
MHEGTSAGTRVVLVGRPNVGKSTLFNRVAGSRRAIVAPVAGTTRDVMRHTVEWLGTEFELVDTGGVFGASADPLQAAVAERGLREVGTAAVIVALVDAREGLVPADEEVVRQARRTGAPLVLAINKVDDRRVGAGAAEFARLAVSPAVSIAAEHGLGVGDLLDAVVARLPGRGRRPADSTSTPVGGEREDREVSIAIVGRPNVGKSSLVNRLAREDRVLVSDRAGTTRDAVDTLVGWHGRRIRLVDTAGIRRPGRVAQAGAVEAVSVVLARRALARADVAVLLVDATAGVTRQDAVIAGEAERAGCGVIIAVNKWDLVKDRGQGYSKTFDAELRRGLRFADFAPILHVSALTGQRAPRIIERAVDVAAARAAHVGTGELNRVVARITAHHRPASPGRRAVKILYATQIGARPPSFVFFTNVATRFHFSYERYLRNQLRDAFGFEGSPIRVRARARREPARRVRRS